jgi:hypothetical protein
MKYIFVILLLAFAAQAEQINRGCLAREFEDPRAFNCTNSPNEIPLSFSRVDGCRSKYKLNFGCIRR